MFQLPHINVSITTLKLTENKHEQAFLCLPISFDNGDVSFVRLLHRQLKHSAYSFLPIITERKREREWSSFTGSLFPPLTFRCVFGVLSLVIALRTVKWCCLLMPDDARVACQCQDWLTQTLLHHEQLRRLKIRTNGN